MGALLLLGVVACQKRPPLVPAAGEPPPLRLDFRPPPERPLTERVRTERTVARAGASQAQVAQMTTVTRFTPMEPGWLLTQTVSSAGRGTAGSSGGEAVLQRFALRVRLATDGTFVAVVDAEAGVRAVRESLPEGPQREALERFFAPEEVETRVRQEWEEKYGGLFRRNLSEGQRTWALVRAPVEEGEVVYLLERTVVGTQPTEHGDALVLSLRCLDAVPAQAPEELREVYAAGGAPALTPGVRCEGEQVVARTRFVPVRRHLTVRARVGEADWTLVTRTQAERLEEAR